MGLFDNDDWYERPSLAFGDQSDITATARVFADVATAMSDARPAAIRFNAGNDEMWQGLTADMVRAQLAEVPEFLRRFHLANDEVADALNGFLPAFISYQDDQRQLRSRGRMMHHEMLSVERRRAHVIARVANDDLGGGDLVGIVGGLLTGYEHDPEVRALTDRLEQLSRDLEIARAQFDGNDHDFEAAVERAADRIWDADGVLYNNGWDKFWSQTAAPILEVVKVVLEIASIVVMVAVLIGSAGTLAPLILAVALFAVNAAQVAGTLGAGREVTGEMWFSLGMSALGVITAGAAHWAKGLRAASAANKLEADKLLNARTGFDNAAKAAGRMENVKSFASAADKMDDVARGFEVLEGAGTMVEGGIDVHQGIQEGDWLKAVGGGLGIAGGAFDVGGFDAPDLGLVADAGETAADTGNVIGDGAKIGSGLIGIADGVGNIVDGIPEQPGTESPKDWPGLGGAQPQ